MPATRFATRVDGIADRMTGFMAHLRYNGMTVGVAETECALEALTQIDATDPQQARLALKAICANDADRFDRFDELFKAYWFNQGRERSRAGREEEKPHQKNRWTNQS